MLSGTAAGAEKPIRALALEACTSDWLRARDFHDVQGASFRPNNRTNTRLQPMPARCDVSRGSKAAEGMDERARLISLREEERPGEDTMTL